MTRLLTLLVILLATQNSWATQPPTTLEELVDQVRQQRILESKALSERERQFRQARDQQKILLEQIKAELRREQQLGLELKTRHEENEEIITNDSGQLHEKMGSLGELFGVFRLSAKDAHGVLSSSLISAQNPSREALMGRLAKLKDNPSIEQMESFWHLVLDEMVESGKVVRFNAPVITNDGEELEREVVRIGTFNVVSEGTYLKYLPETGRLVELGRQPPYRFQSLALALQQADSGFHSMSVDPSRGAILSLMVQSPSVVERIQQGGIIGYIIIGLGALALLLILERATILAFTRHKMKRQLRIETPRLNNPLGRLRQVNEQNPAANADILGSKLDQSIIKEIPRLRRYLPTLAVFAAVAPLLGLLGTVTGMIETFQSITLFGTGDPKLMSGGISHALVTTELGLIVAIPILLLHNWLSGNARQLVYLLDVENAALVGRREESNHAITA